jgi:uncharacterized repeat protein (TIGR03803 family)
MWVVAWIAANGVAFSASIQESDRPANRRASDFVQSGPYRYVLTVDGGTFGCGSILRMDAAGRAVTVASFDCTTQGGSPRGVMTPYGEALYGTTQRFGANGCGTVFRFDPLSGTLTALAALDYDITGCQANNGLTVSGSFLYGTTSIGGMSGYGGPFRVDPLTGKLLPLGSVGLSSFSISLSVNGTVNPYAPASNAIFPADPVGFIASTTSPAFNVTWDFGNPESANNTVFSTTGTTVTHQYNGLTSAFNFPSVRTVSATSAVDGSMNSTNLTLSRPSQRYVIRNVPLFFSAFSGSPSPVAGDQFVDASDGRMESHYAAWVLDGSPTKTMPGTGISVGGCGSHTMSIDAHYVSYNSSFVPGNPNEYLTTISGVSYVVRPFTIAMATPTPGSTTITFSAASRLASDASALLPGATWSTNWSLKNSGGADLVAPVSTTANAGIIPQFVVSKSSVQANSVARLTVTMSASSLSLSCTPYNSVTVSQTLTPPSISPGASLNVVDGSPGISATLAVVSDAEDPASALNVSIGPGLPVGLTVSNITNSGGTVTATITAACNTPSGNYALTVSVQDSTGLTSTTSVPIHVTANPAPVLGNYNDTTVGPGGSTAVIPSVPPFDNGFVALGASASPGFTGTVSANSATGVVSINNANPGSYIIAVTATDNCGATTTASFPLHVSGPITILFGVNPSSIAPGDSITLTWSTTNATSVSIDNGIGSVATSGSKTITGPSVTTTYTLTATGAGGTMTAQATVTVLTPLSGGITAIPAAIHSGEGILLIWSSAGGIVSIDNGVGTNLTASGSVNLFPTRTTTYILRVVSPDGVVTSSTTVTVLTAAPPTISSFAAVPASINPGTAVTLSWASSGAKSATIDNSVGSVSPAGGSTSVSPAVTTIYTLTGRGDGGVVTRAVTVQVSNTAAPLVSKVAGTGQAGSADGLASAASFTKPFAVAVVPRTALGAKPDATLSYDIYVLDSNHTIRKISPDGLTETWAGKAGVRGSANGFRTSATFDFSNFVGAIVANTDGSFLIVDANGRQRLIDSSGQVSLYRPPGCGASCGNFSLPAGIVVLPDKTILTSDAGNHTVTRVSPAGVTTVIGLVGQPGMHDGPADQAQFNSPRGMTIDAAGNVYVLDTLNNAIRKINSQNIVSTVTASGSATGGGDLNLGCCATGIASSKDGGVYLTDPGSNTVKRVSGNGSITTVAGSGAAGSSDGNGSAAGFNNPLGVSTTPDGSLIVTDTNNNTIRSVQAPPAAPPRRRSVKH